MYIALLLGYHTKQTAVNQSRKHDYWYIIISVTNATVNSLNSLLGPYKCQILYN